MKVLSGFGISGHSESENKRQHLQAVSELQIFSLQGKMFLGKDFSPGLGKYSLLFRSERSFLLSEFPLKLFRVDHVSKESINQGLDPDLYGRELFHAQMIPIGTFGVKKCYTFVMINYIVSIGILIRV